MSELFGGGSNDAGFVQVMKSAGIDRARVEAMDERMKDYEALRSDVLGGIRAWTAADACTELVYFTSEAEARAGEAQDLPEDVQQIFAEFGELMAGTTFLDLKRPQLR